MRNPDLYARLEALPLDDPAAARPFSKRLAAEQGWSADFTARAMREYKRFLYLGACAGPATPSKVIDEVWHLHLLYTRSYWDDLCGEILTRPLHHDPSRGGVPDASLHERQYLDTLARYREEFGEDPPSDLWPQPAENAGAFRRIRPAAVVGALLCCLIFGGGAALSGDVKTWLIFLAPFILGAAIVAGGLLWLYRNVHISSRDSNEGYCGSSRCGSHYISCASSNDNSDSGSSDSGGSSCGGSGCGGGGD